MDIGVGGWGVGNKPLSEKKLQFNSIFLLSCYSN